ncbi:MAG: hypothetical protein ACRDT0_06925, partial [Pseudonocardiaceae bacterium]
DAPRRADRGSTLKRRTARPGRRSGRRLLAVWDGAPARGYGGIAMCSPPLGNRPAGHRHPAPVRRSLLTRAGAGMATSCLVGAGPAQRSPLR